MHRFGIIEMGGGVVQMSIYFLQDCSSNPILECISRYFLFDAIILKLLLQLVSFFKLKSHFQSICFYM